jgi:hypothetical protein
MFWLLAVVRTLLTWLHGAEGSVRCAMRAWVENETRGPQIARRRWLAGVGRDPNDGGMHVGPVLKVCVDSLQVLSGNPPGAVLAGGLAWSNDSRFSTTRGTIPVNQEHTFRRRLDSV